jgi:hypothetical protein
MDTRDSSNLDVKYVEVVTCTYEDLCGMKTPVNGRLYHTSDTNEFFYDWNNKRHKLSVFSTGGPSESGAVISKTELSNWLRENNYLTNLSLTDAIVEIIGAPIREIITKQALENYSRNYLLTKEELNMLDQPLEFVERLRGLENSNSSLYEYYNRLAEDISNVRLLANDRISAGDLGSALEDYVSKDEAGSVYLTKDDAASTYVSNGDLDGRLSGYVTRDGLGGSLAPYQTKSEAAGKFLTKSDASIYLKKTAAHETYVEKRELSDYETKAGVNEKLSGYVSKADAGNFVTKDMAGAYLTGADLTGYARVEDMNDTLSVFAKKMWVDENYMRKTDIPERLAPYATTEYLEGRLRLYETAESAGRRSAAMSDRIDAIDTRLSGYTTKTELGNTLNGYVTRSDMSAYMTKTDADTRFSAYVRKEDIPASLDGLETTESVDRKIAAMDEKVQAVGNRLSGYPTRSEMRSTLDGYATRASLASLVTKDALNVRFSEYSKTSDIESRLEAYGRKSDIDARLEGYVTTEQADGTYMRKSELTGYVKVGDMNDTLSVFAKKMWVDENYMRKFDLEEYSKREEVESLLDGVEERMGGFLTLEDVNGMFMPKSDLTGYAKVSDVDDTLSVFAKKMWVDENYMRKFDLGEYPKRNEVESIVSGAVGGMSGNFLTLDEAGDMFMPKSDLTGYAKAADVNETLSVFAKKFWVDENYMRKFNLEEYPNRYEVGTELRKYETKEGVDEKIRDFITLDDVRDMFLSPSSLDGYVTVEGMNNTLAVFAKKFWVDENYMRKFNLEEYMKASDIYNTFIDKSTADSIYLSKEEADNLYLKINSVVNKTGDYVERYEMESFAKKVWVDENYMRKSQMAGIQDAMVLSKEFGTRQQLMAAERRIQQGFYYLTDDDEMWVAINMTQQPNSEKIFVNITNLEATFALYFGGDDVNW